MAMARLRMIVAGALAVARREFGGMGAQLSNLTFFMELALKTDLEAAGFFLTEQGSELKQIGRGCQDIKQIEAQLRQPVQMLISKVAEDPQAK